MNKNPLDEVITTKEACERYNIADCTVRSWIKDKLLDDKEVRKSGNIWLVVLEALKRVLKQKDMYSKEFNFEGKKISAEILGYKDKTLQIWYESERLNTFIQSLPYKETIPQIFKIFRKESRMRFQYLVITDERNASDNWYVPSDKLWVITLKGLLNIIEQTLVKQRIDLTEFEAYKEEHLG